MPELPEVETVARGLQRSVLGRRIVSVRLGKTDFIDDPAALEQHLPGRQIEKVERYGKFMLLRLSAGNGRPKTAAKGDGGKGSFLVHLGKTRELGPCPPAQPCRKQNPRFFQMGYGGEARHAPPP